MPNSVELPPKYEVIEVLRYDQSNGRLYNRETGEEQQTMIGGKLHTRYYGRYYATHRLVWLMETGDTDPPRLRFKNGDIFDTRYCNLGPSVPAYASKDVPPTRDELLAMFDYKAEEGQLYKKGRRHPASFRYAGGYIGVSVRGVVRPLSHLVWIIERGYAPQGQVRFKDGDRMNTRIGNLVCKGARIKVDWNNQEICDAEARTRSRIAEIIGEDISTWKPIDVYPLT